MSKKSIAGCLALATIMAPNLAFAHVGLGDGHDLLHGFSHPLSGIDHILVMFAVGLLAANLGGRAFYAVPLSFVTMMAIGGVLGMAGLELPFTEMGIGVSVVVLGALIASDVKLSASIATMLAAVFAIFHGYAHGVEMPADAGGLLFAAGFVSATALLHLGGIAFGVIIQRSASVSFYQAIRFGGGAMAIAGIGLLSGMI